MRYVEVRTTPELGVKGRPEGLGPQGDVGGCLWAKGLPWGSSLPGDVVVPPFLPPCRESLIGHWQLNLRKEGSPLSHVASQPTTLDCGAGMGCLCWIGGLLLKPSFLQDGGS